MMDEKGADGSKALLTRMPILGGLPDRSLNLPGVADAADNAQRTAACGFDLRHHGLHV
ncbi:hypothetical protein IBL26_00760 [Roseomonas aerophila]|uniref:Uncharacterized protein n=1 Tax=Teichococcus aerophilus TaxID=1224513 RepID=A0ABR7RFK9_9PROT|nr:hypothetical protein [Pseudoroseomonas aerophila]MBC9205349.1 hypothetical protein [Pseudoroseomonas aerophila]